jgi:hypothetical protein
MMQQPYRTPFLPWLTFIVASLALIASIGGIFIEGLYHDNSDIRGGWFVNDLITIPMSILLIVTWLMQKRGDERPMLVWMGSMLYMFYNYAFYLFGAKFNAFFLIYTALFSFSLFSIIIGLLNINIHAIHESVAFRKRQRLISVFLFLLAVPLFILEVKQCLTFIFSSKSPEAPTLIFALDLSTVVPITILASVLLWKNHPWGNVLATMMLVKSFAYGLVLLSSTLLTVRYDPLLPFYAFVAVGGLVFTLLHLSDLKPSQQLK